MKVAVIGATGLVGQKMLQVLAERNLPIDELIVAASERSIGKKTLFKGKEYTLVSVEDAIEKRPDIAIFSAGADASLKYAPLFAEKGTYPSRQVRMAVSSLLSRRRFIHHSSFRNGQRRHMACAHLLQR